MRIRVLGSRLEPYLAEVSAHYYRARPPRVAAVRSLEGMVSLAPADDGFRWNRGKAMAGFTEGTTVRYTTDGSEPDASSPEHPAPFPLGCGVLKARAYLNGKGGAVVEARFGL